MAITPVSSAPQPADFRSRAEHEQQTPVSFFAGPPVLYLHAAAAATVLVSRAQLRETVVLRRLWRGAAGAAAGEAEAEAEGVADVEGEEGAGEDGEDVAVSGVSVWVTSRNLILFGAQEGVAIAYPSIALHAMGTHESRHLPDGAAPVVFLQINMHDPETTNSDDEMHTLDLTIHLTGITTPSTDAPGEGADGSSAQDAPTSPIKALFEALSACADLHPDPDEDAGDVDGDAGLDTTPGAGGWITAENMNDFVDEQGNFVMPSSAAGAAASLGPGAGTVRTREDADGHGHGHGVNGDADETKWQRTG